jgi:hypothetical protein
VRSGSWRMKVGRDRWSGDTRHVEAIDELIDVTLCGAHDPAYGDAAPIEYRTQTGGERRQEGAEMDPKDGASSTAESTETETTEDTAEQRTTESPTLQVPPSPGSGGGNLGWSSATQRRAVVWRTSSEPLVGPARSRRFRGRRTSRGP